MVAEAPVNIVRPGCYPEDQAPRSFLRSTLLEQVIRQKGIEDTLTSSDHPSTGSSVDMFMHEIHRYPILRSENEQRLFKHMSNGDSIEDLANDAEFVGSLGPRELIKTRRVLLDCSSLEQVAICCNFGLVIEFGKPFMRVMSLEDIIQEGALGLREAVRKFDYKRGYKLSTYACWWIKQSIQCALADTGTTIRFPVHVHEKLSAANKISQGYSFRYGEDPLPGELRDLILARKDISPTEADSVIRILSLGIHNPLSLKPLSLDHAVDAHHETELVELIPDRTQDVDGEALGLVENSDTQARVRRALDNHPTLTPRQRRLLEERFGLVDRKGKTLDQVGKMFGLTRERVRQIEAKALKILYDDPDLRQIWEADGVPLEQISNGKIHKVPQVFQSRVHWGQEVVESARKDPAVWEQFSRRAQSMFEFYFCRSEHLVSKRRLAAIFKIDMEQLDKEVSDYLSEVVRLLWSERKRTMKKWAVNT
ncbi:MAG: sigma-70 family RNA polymerase sigma factor [Candidatus Blackburnbacteria bacterium]|nr:sigma-70 family RNA polymerase sigma factor [Candidatus Blackburnbacteria bacterium]